jgi:hypothetical protein
LTAAALVQAVHRAGQGRSALLKWEADVARVLDPATPAERVYGRDAGSLEEGFPLLPVGALLLAPFLFVGGSGGAVLFALVKIALAWWMLASALRLAGAPARDWPPWAAALVVALSARVLISDVAHGNVNIPVGAAVVAGALAWSRGQDWRAGLWAGLGTALKVTPGLLLVYFAWKRSARAAVGWLAGLLVAGLILPAPFVGGARSLELARAWWRQMVAPYAGGAPVTLVQTQQTNQSYLGVLARWTTDSIAIDSDPPVSIHVLELSQRELRALHAAAVLATLCALAWCARPREGRGAPIALGEFALLALAMLFLSERSWKHHWVLLMLPVAFLTWIVAEPGAATRGERRLALAALAVSAALHGLTGSGVLGARGSDLAEAYGAFLWGGLVLFAAVGFLLRRRAGAG